MQSGQHSKCKFTFWCKSLVNYSFQVISYLHSRHQQIHLCTVNDINCRLTLQQKQKLYNPIQLNCISITLQVSSINRVLRNLASENQKQMAAGGMYPALYNGQWGRPTGWYHPNNPAALSAQYPQSIPPAPQDIKPKGERIHVMIINLHSESFEVHFQKKLILSHCDMGRYVCKLFTCWSFSHAACIEMQSSKSSILEPRRQRCNAALGKRTCFLV